MAERTVRTQVPLHARPLDRFVREARRFAATIRLIYGDKQADGKNVLQLLLLAVPAGADVRLQVEGSDEEPALRTLASQLEADEPDAPTKPTPQPTPVQAESIQAVPGAPGVAVGRALRPRAAAVAEQPATSPRKELERLEQALLAAERVTAALIDDDDPFCDIFRAQQTLLGDPDLRGELERAVQGGRPAHEAAGWAFAELQRRFDGLGPGFAAERHCDVADVRDRLLEALVGHADHQPGDGPTVLVLDEATPSRMATLDLEQVVGVVSTRGGPTSHAAIVARGRGIPLVFAAAPRLSSITDGQWLQLDGECGTIEPLPDGEARRRRSIGQQRPLSTGACVTSDNHPVTLRANLGAPGELEVARRGGAHGCGLLRTELLFAGRRGAPTVEEQVAAYARVARALAPHPVVVRLFDAGSDKPLPFLPANEQERNPALGLRGVRLLLRHRQVLARQLEAVGQARVESSCDLRVMIPMLNDVAELAQVRELAPDGLPLGAMVETPAAALLARSIAAQVSFVSIGSNDLTQYTLAADRQLSAAGGSLLHPAVLQLVACTVAAARAAHVECSVCGELAGDAGVAPLLVGLGVTTLSVAPPRLARIAAAIRRWASSELEELARRALALQDPVELDRLIRDSLKGT